MARLILVGLEADMAHCWGRAASIALALLTAAACAGGDIGVRRRQALSRAIADDAAAYNEAYSSAINGQILLNVLRAANRQPRQYMSMSGFSSDAPGTRGTTLGVSGLPLDQLGQNWGVGSVNLSATDRVAPSFEVSPFGEDDFANIALRPTSIGVFRHYWDTGWNPDLLLFVLVDRMEIANRDGSGARVLTNSPGTIDRDCEGEAYSFGGCAFVREVRALTQAMRAGLPQTGGADLCAPLVYAEAPGGQARKRPASAKQAQPPLRAAGFAGPCPVTIIMGGQRYTLSLRSLDAMIYYVGELVRPNQLSPAPAGGALVARLGVVAPGYFSPEDRAPLFRIDPADARSERDYAATVSYAGRRYSAGAPASRFCFDPASPEACRGGPVTGDRSGSVLELLAGILAYNQSQTVVSAPQGAVLNVR